MTKRQLVTSLRVDPDLWKEAKVQAIRNDMTLGELVEVAIRKWIESCSEADLYEKQRK